MWCARREKSKNFKIHLKNRIVADTTESFTSKRKHCGYILFFWQEHYPGHRDLACQQLSEISVHGKTFRLILTQCNFSYYLHNKARSRLRTCRNVFSLTGITFSHMNRLNSIDFDITSPFIWYPIDIRKSQKRKNYQPQQQHRNATTTSTCRSTGTNNITENIDFAMRTWMFTWASLPFPVKAQLYEPSMLIHFAYNRDHWFSDITENIGLTMGTWMFTWAFFAISCKTNVTSTAVRTIGVDTLCVQITINAGQFRTFINVWNGKDGSVFETYKSSTSFIIDFAHVLFCYDILYLYNCIHHHDNRWDIHSDMKQRSSHISHLHDMSGCCENIHSGLKYKICCSYWWLHGVLCQMKSSLTFSVFE
jgi:hypothetical protein